ncbi:hypothetical protein HDE_07598 [Halotydeus destructor]|nr:hypothetical protein HDE_07598 [Halotydeus destructor]
MAGKQVQSGLHWKLRALWFSLCVAGNTYQAYTLASTYLSYDVATQVRIKFPENFKPPAPSLCFALISMVKLDIAFARWPDLKARMGKAKQVLAGLNDTSFKEAIAQMPFNEKIVLSEFIFENLKVDEAFAITYHQEDLFEVCRIVRSSDYTFAFTRCDDLYHITESFKSAVKCFTFKLKERQNYNYLTIQRMKLFPGMQSSIIMRNSIRNLTRDITVYFHLQDTYSREGFSRLIFLTPMELFTMTYVAYDIKLLPAPFNTDCQDYTVSGYFDRGDCFEKCVNKQSLDKMGKLSPGPAILLQEFANERLIAAETVINNATVRNTVYAIYDHCDKYCSKRDCKDKYYIPQLMALNKFDFPCFMTLVEQEPRVTSTFFPKLDLIEFITDLFSTLGFWIGTSGLSVFDFMWTTFSSRRPKTLRDAVKAVPVVSRKLQPKTIYFQDGRLEKRPLDRHLRKVGSTSEVIAEITSDRARQQLGPMFRANFFKL